LKNVESDAIAVYLKNKKKIVKVESKLEKKFYNFQFLSAQRVSMEISIVLARILRTATEPFVKNL